MEVLVSLAIVSIILAAMTGVFERSGRLYTTQNATAALQQEVRAALDVIASEARMAAYMPRKGGDTFAIRTANATRLRFEADLDEDGVKAASYNGDGECENRSFRFSLLTNAVQMVCGEGTGTVDIESLIGGANANVRVTALDFAYYDRHNDPVTILAEIRGAVITITARTPAGRDGWIERTYSTSVDFRNTGPNA
jgi:type II secretory pathway pseudopilin PulG